MALVLHNDGRIETVYPQQPPSFSLEEMQKLVGGYIQHIRLPDQSLLIFDEEGKLKDKPYNRQATLRARPVLMRGDYIVGAAVVLSDEEMGE
jgi:hypothetical protein